MDYRMLPMSPRAITSPARLVLLAALLATAAVYALGLPGNFILDDIHNFQPIQRWIQGELPWSAVVFGNESGPLGRPIAMASFVLSAALHGLDPLGFKATNIAIHGACGVLLHLVLRRLLTALALGATHASLTAAACTAVWLLLPIHISTVLYSVQRMALLSTFFVLLALWLYLRARAQMLGGRLGSGSALLWLGVPLATATAMYCKENGVVAIPLIVVIELVLRAQCHARSPAQVTAFVGVFFVLPLAVVGGYALLRIDALEASFATRDFTLYERLLTQARVLWDYVHDVALPGGRSVGLYNDDYPLSRGILTPPSTAIAIMAWLLTLATALALRKRQPLPSVGILWFLAAHSLEAGPIPLEVYFEHRNHLPSAGLALVAAGLVLGTLRLTAAHGAAVRRLAAAGIALVVTAYGAATATRASIWRDERILFASALAAAPDSPRLLGTLAARSAGDGDLEGALKLLARARAADQPQRRPDYDLFAAILHCEAGQPVPAAVFERIEASAPQRWTLMTMSLYIRAEEALQQRRCAPRDAFRLTHALVTWLEQMRNIPAHSQIAWRSAFHLSGMLGAIGELDRAQQTIDRAAVDSSDNAVVLLRAVDIAILRNDIAGARARLAKLDGERELPSDLNFRRRLDEARAFTGAHQP